MLQPLAYNPQSNERSLRSEIQRPVPKFDEDPFQVNLKPTFTRELEPDIRLLIERMDEQNISLLIINTWMGDNYDKIADFQAVCMFVERKDNCVPNKTILEIAESDVAQANKVFRNLWSIFDQKLSENER